MINGPRYQNKKQTQFAPFEHNTIEHIIYSVGLILFAHKIIEHYCYAVKH